jgi:hypothetical protein
MVIRDLDHNQIATETSSLQKLEGGTESMYLMPTYGFSSLLASFNVVAEGAFVADVKSTFDSITISTSLMKTSGFSFVAASFAVG